ncbi:O-antigen ligase family protein [Georgenia deserti]|uniref:O-antigen ligase family protein n=2 Tax=Georgenia deserti TaxID=2093781 RepID=A0ABW4LA88_9MICO
MVTVYLALLIGWPSSVTISAFGSLGRPAVLWGLGLLVWWVLTRLQEGDDRGTQRRPQPVRWAYGALLVVVLISFAAAMFRGQPGDQVTVAISSVLRILSWGGVLLVLADGIRTREELEQLLGRLTLAGTLLAGLGLLQFVLQQSMLDWFGNLPGLSADLGGVDSRGAFTRAAGTAAHPLEYTAVICAVLPLAVTVGLARARAGRGRLPWTWIPAGVLVLAALLSVSRSAVVGLVVAVLLSLPALPRTYRWIVALSCMGAVMAVIALVPGMYGTMTELFTGATEDPSTLSRTNALAHVPDFVAASPVIGLAFGTFLPRYYIFDNQWVLLTLELGLVGAAAFTLLVLSAVWSSANAARRAAAPGPDAVARGIAASMLTVSVMFLFFDGLSFTMSGGMFFLLAGAAAAARAVARPGHPATRVRSRNVT